MKRLYVTAIRDENVLDAAMNAVIIYDKIDCAVKANAMLEFDDHALVEDKSSRFASDLHEREVSLTPTLQHILEQPVRDNYQPWGIND